MSKLYFPLLVLFCLSLTNCQQKNKTVAEGNTASTVAEQSPPKTNVAPGAKEEWTVLFDGISGAHWRSYNGEGFPEKGWMVQNGALTLLDKSQGGDIITCLLYTSPSPRDATLSRMPSSA